MMTYIWDSSLAEVPTVLTIFMVGTKEWAILSASLIFVRQGGGLCDCEWGLHWLHSTGSRPGTSDIIGRDSSPPFETDINDLVRFK